MPTTYNHGLSKGKNAGAAITKKRFVFIDTSADDGETVIQADDADSATEPLYGVSVFSVSEAEIAQGKGVTVVLSGRAIVEAGVALPVGSVVTADSDGKAVVATTGDWIGGVVDEPAVNVGDDCSIVIACNGSMAA